MKDSPMIPGNPLAAQYDGQPLDLLSTYVHLRDDGAVSLISTGDNFWAEVTRSEHTELDVGRLVLRFEFEENWPTWERHPHGEELVILIRGSAQLVLQGSEGEQRVRLAEPGQFACIPRGVWHTAHPERPCSMLFITPGRDTEHRPA